MMGAAASVSSKPLALLVRAFAYQWAMAFGNYLGRGLKRLRQPKYWLGTLFAVGYFAWLIHINSKGITNHDGKPVAMAMTPHRVQLFSAALAIVLLLGLVRDWLFSGDEVRLRFSETEIAFLFPAPFTRNALVHFNLLRSALASLLTALLFGLVFLHRLFALFGVGTLQGAVGLWLILFTLNLHAIASSFTRERLLGFGVGTTLRRIVVAAIVLLFVVACAWSLRAKLQLSEYSDAKGLAGHLLDALANTAPMSWVLVPLRWLVAPVFARDSVEFLRALVPGVLVLALHYVWAVRAQVSFEDGSIAYAARRAERIAAMRAGRGLGVGRPMKARSGPFALAAQGGPVVAFLWKGLLAMGRLYSPRNFLIACVVLVVACQRLFKLEFWGQEFALIGLIIAGVGLWFVLLVPFMAASTSLRRAFERMDVIKAMPLRGWQIALGEIITPVLVMSASAWLLLLLGMQAAPAMQVAHPDQPIYVLAEALPHAWFAIGFGLAICMPPLCALMMCLPFAGMLYFPAFVTRLGGGAGTAQRFESQGMAWLFMLGYFAVLAACLVPVGLLGLLAFLLLRWLAGLTAALLVTAIVCSVLLVLETWLAVAQLGYRIDQFDLSQEMR